MISGRLFSPSKFLRLIRLQSTINTHFGSLVSLQSLHDAYIYAQTNIGAIDPNLMEVYAYSLIRSRPLLASTAFFHLVAQNNLLHHFSHELWALYLGSVAENADYRGAILIYHNLICPPSDTDVPFLINPQMLCTLGTLFKRNSDSRRIKGLLCYFKRFYSYIHNTSTLKLLNIDLVEAYSLANDWEHALEAFRHTASLFRGHTNSKHWLAYSKPLQANVTQNWYLRRSNIRNNVNDGPMVEIDPVQQQWLLDAKIPKPYTPSINRNIYTGFKSHSPLLVGSLSVVDMPEFARLVTKMLDLQIASNDLHIDAQLALCLKCHPALHLFIVAGLCELGRVREACLMLHKIRQVFPAINQRVLLRDESFLTILHSCSSQFSGARSDQILKQCAGSAVDLFEIIRAAVKPKSRKSIASRVHVGYIECLLNSPTTNIDDIAHGLARLTDPTIYLPRYLVEKLQAMVCDSPSDLLHVLRRVEAI